MRFEPLKKTWSVPSGGMTIAALPKRYIDATRDPDPNLDQESNNG